MNSIANELLQYKTAILQGHFADEADNEKIEAGRLNRDVKDKTDDDKVVIMALENELKYARDQVHLILEMNKTSSGKLKASNKELQLTNEELYSMAEELETSLDELHSVNKELNNLN